MPDVSLSILSGNFWFDVLLAKYLRHLFGDILHAIALATADVEHAIHRARFFQRQPARALYVMNADKVPALLPVLEDYGRLVVQQPGRKNRQDSRVGVRKRLPRAVNVEEAQRHDRNAVRPADHQAHALLAVLVKRIDRGNIGLLTFWCGDRR